MFKAVAFKLVDGEWVEYRRTQVAFPSRNEAARSVSRSLPLGYGGHGISDRTHEAIARGEIKATPLGTWKVDTYRQSSDGQRWVSLAGHSL